MSATKLAQSLLQMKMPKLDVLGGFDYFDRSNQFDLDEIRLLLEDDRVSQRIEGVKRLIAMISRGEECSSMFPSVLKGIGIYNIDYLRLAFTFMNHYTDFNQEIILLSTGTLMKGSYDKDPLYRAFSYRTLAGLRNRVLCPIQISEIKRLSVDSSAFVRKTVVQAIPKIIWMSREPEEAIPHIEHFLKDKSVIVLESALKTFDRVCPERYDLLHAQFRRICTKIVDFDEWSQVHTIDVLTRYIRVHFVDPNPSVLSDNATNHHDHQGEDFLMAGSSHSSREENNLDPDHAFALKCLSPLFHSRNSAVVLALSSLFFYCAPRALALRAGKALVCATRDRASIQFLLLQNIATMAVSRPDMFTPFVERFFLDGTEPNFVSHLKVDILGSITTLINVLRVLRELQRYSVGEVKTARVAIQSIARIAIRLKEVRRECTKILVSLLSHRSDAVVEESVVALKDMLQIGSEGERRRIMKKLVRLVEVVKKPEAKASVIWCVGEYATQIPDLAPDVLRKLAINFPNEPSDLVKMQTLSLSSKLVLTNPDQTHLLFQYVLHLAKYDPSYDIRDKARALRSILTRPGSLLFHLSRRLLLTSKPPPDGHSPFKARERWSLGSMSMVFDQEVPGHLVVPQWSESVRASKERNTSLALPLRKDFVSFNGDSQIRLSPRSRLRPSPSFEENDSSSCSDLTHSYDSDDSRSFRSSDDDYDDGDSDSRSYTSYDSEEDSRSYDSDYSARSFDSDYSARSYNSDYSAQSREEHFDGPKSVKDDDNEENDDEDQHSLAHSVSIPLIKLNERESSGPTDKNEDEKQKEEEDEDEEQEPTESDRLV